MRDRRNGIVALPSLQVLQTYNKCLPQHDQLGISIKKRKFHSKFQYKFSDNEREVSSILGIIFITDWETPEKWSNNLNRQPDVARL